MLPELSAFLALCLWGAWVALDGTSVGQLMISRPVVAATLAGGIVGAPAQGAVLGVLLEALHLTVLPVGAARYPEGGPAAVVAAGVYAGSGLGASALLATLVFTLLWERLGGETVRQLRQFNVRLVAPASGGRLNPSALQRRHLSAVALDFSRGLVLVGAGLPLLALFLSWTERAWSLGEQVPAVVLGAVAAGALAGALQLFGGRNRLVLFLIGVVVGAAVLLLP